MVARFADEGAARAFHLARTVLREPFQRRSWRELAFFLVSSALAIGGVLVLGAFGFLGLLLAAALVGVLLLASGLRFARGLGGWQRALAHSLLGETVPEPEPFARRPGFFGWLRSCFGDRAAWRAVGYFVAKIPLTLIGVWFALSVWLEAFTSILSAVTGSRVSGRFGVFGGLLRPAYRSSPVGGGVAVSGAAQSLGVFLTGVILVFIAPWMMRLVVNADRWLMELLLGPDPTTTRVRTLEESRARTVDAAATQLRRIERDLHDGTQAQLVALAMRLGQAKEKLDRLGDVEGGGADVEGIRRLVDEAHRGAKEAIVDLRDLARGIHPPALDTGLGNALATLGARSPVPTEVTVDLASRLPGAIEAIGYFCAAELLANVAQHSDATRATLTCAQHGPWFRIVVRDDGRGGAAVSHDGGPSSGLAGLADRVEAVDGHLSIASPPGGPTIVTVDIPLPESSR